MNIALLIPTYNEAENIRTLLPRLASLQAHHPAVHLFVYVIDDNSPDCTWLIAESLENSLCSKNFRLKTLRREHKEGLGMAYIYGFRYVLKDSSIDYVVQMDADLSHDPAYLEKFFGLAERGVDLVVASRYMPGGGIPDWSWYRKLLSRFGNLYAKLLLGNTISDFTGGFNMYSTRLLKRIDFDRLNAPGYGFLITLKFEALRKANFVSQFPIVFVDRKVGESKMPLSTLANNFKLVLNLWRKK